MEVVTAKKMDGARQRGSSPPDFFRKSTEGAGVCHLVPETQEVTTSDMARIHSEGLPFLEVESGAWFHLRLDEEPPRLYSQSAGLLARQSKLQDELLLRVEQWQTAQFDVLPGREPWDREPWEHVVEISADGMREKLDVYTHNFRHFTPEQSTERMVSVVSRALESPIDQFYSEEIVALLQRGAVPTKEVLDKVRRNEHLNSSVRQKTIKALEERMESLGGHRKSPR